MMVEYIECFGSELEGCAFSELEILAKPEVPIIDPRPADNVPATISELPSKRLNESRRVEPVVDAVLAAGISNLIAALGEGQEQSKVVVAKNREWETFLKRSNSCDLPSTDG